MKQYKEFLENILKNGVKKDDRTGTGTISLFGPQMEFDLRDGFPIVTTKKLFLKGVIAELLWFLEGSTDERRILQYTKKRAQYRRHKDTQRRHQGNHNKKTPKQKRQKQKKQSKTTVRTIRKRTKENNKQ